MLHMICSWVLQNFYLETFICNKSFRINQVADHQAGDISVWSEIFYFLGPDPIGFGLWPAIKHVQICLNNKSEIVISPFESLGVFSNWLIISTIFWVSSKSNLKSTMDRYLLLFDNFSILENALRPLIYPKHKMLHKLDTIRSESNQYIHFI